jgi:kynurenine formamidase
MDTLKHAGLAAAALAVLATAACEAPAPRPPVRPPDGIFEGLLDGRTRIVDLTHALNSENPHWPGPGYEPFSYEVFATLEDDGVLSGRFGLAEHTGTHLDAPNHFVAGQVPVDRIPVERLIVPMIVIDARDAVTADPDYQLTPEDLVEWEVAHGPVPPNALVALYTGWEGRWTDFEQYQNRDSEGQMHFPGFSPAVTEILVTERDVAGLAIDTLSVDYGLSEDFRVHLISHGQGRYHLENVANLGSVPPTDAWVIVAPIKIENGTGGPARVLALVRAEESP